MAQFAHSLYYLFCKLKLNRLTDVFVTISGITSPRCFDAFLVLLNLDPTMIGSVFCSRINCFFGDSFCPAVFSVEQRKCLSVLYYNAVVTCEIKLFQNYFSLRRRPSEIISFQRVETCLKLFQNYFTGLSQLTNTFHHVRFRLNNFEIILELFQRLK